MRCSVNFDLNAQPRQERATKNFARWTPSQAEKRQIFSFSVSINWRIVNKLIKTQWNSWRCPQQVFLPWGFYQVSAIHSHLCHANMSLELYCKWKKFPFGRSAVKWCSFFALYNHLSKKTRIRIYYNRVYYNWNSLCEWRVKLFSWWHFRCDHRRQSPIGTRIIIIKFRKWNKRMNARSFSSKWNTQISHTQTHT